MKSSPQPNEHRRAFFRSAGRTAVLGTMGLLGLLVYGRERKTPARQTCINRSVCCTCHVFGACELPAARSAKQAKGGAGDNGPERTSGLRAQAVPRDVARTSACPPKRRARRWVPRSANQEGTVL